MGSAHSSQPAAAGLQQRVGRREISIDCCSSGVRWRAGFIASTTGAVPANQRISDGEATDRCKSLRRKMADCPSKY